MDSDRDLANALDIPSVPELPALALTQLDGCFVEGEQLLLLLRHDDSFL